MYIEKQNGGLEMKKLLVVLLALTMMLPAFVSAQTLDPNEKVTLNLFGTANFVDVGPDGMMDLLSGVEMPGYNELIAEWNKLHPNVEIVVKLVRGIVG